MRISDWSSDVCSSDLAPLQSLGFRSKVTTESGAAFGQATVPLWTGANITGGLRYTIERRGVKGFTQLTFLPVAGGGSLQTGLTDAHTTFKKLTRSEEHTSELQSLMRISYAVFCLKKKKKK